MHAKLAKEKETYGKFNKELRAEAATKSDNFIKTLSATQAMIKSLFKEMMEGKSKFREVRNQVQLLQNFCMQLQEKLSSSRINKLQPELCKVFEILFSKMSVLREKNDDIQDEIATLHVGVEEERRYRPTPLLTALPFVMVLFACIN